ncbi:hypothetical protein ACFLSV_01840 [Bacteroidota bacterium]
MKKIIIISLVFLFCLFILSENIFAIPAFARMYKMSCQTCHSPMPRLKAYGDEFAGNGFVLSDQDAPRYFVDTGDEDLSLIRDIPIAVRLEGYLTYNNRNSDQSDFTAPYLLKLLSGGSIGTDLAYYFYFFLSERGEVAGVEDAYLMFNNLFSTELDVYVGQFQVSDPLFKRELRLTFEDYQIYRTNVGRSDINLTYDRGVMLTYGFETGTSLMFEVLNGSGIGEGNPFRNFDNDKHKNFFGRISQDIGDFLRVGGFGYYGKEAFMSESESYKNEMWMAGPDLTLSYGNILELNLQYVERKDKQSLSNVGMDIKTRGAMGELIVTPEGDESKWYGVGLFNWVESDESFLNYKTATLHLGYLLKRNVRMVSEFTYDFKNKYGQVGIGFIAAF